MSGPVTRTTWPRAARSAIWSCAATTADGNLRFVSVSGEPLFDEQGRFRGYRGVGRDITEKKLAERALRASEARLKSLVNLSLRLVLGAGRRSCASP